MKRDILLYSWMIILVTLLIGLAIWAIWFIPQIDNKIAVFGIIAVITAAFTSVLTVSINNKKAKEREYELLVLKEKQKVYEHFYNSFYELLERSRTGKSKLSPKAISEMMLFKKGLMNWGSERLINKFIDYDNKVSSPTTNTDILDYGNVFLKEIRKEMGFNDSKSLNIMSIILTADARQDMIDNKNR